MYSEVTDTFISYCSTYPLTLTNRDTDAFVLHDSSYKRMTKLAIATLIIPFAFAAARPVGVPNFHRVSERIYRGAQPTPQGFQTLAKMGIKTVVDLRREPEQFQAEQHLVEALDMKFLSVPMSMQA